MKILITGAEGQVGNAITEQSKYFNFKIFSFNRRALDITDTNNIKTKFELVKPDLVINAAAYTKVDEAENESDAAFMINSIGALNLANLCRSTKVPLFHISTDYVFDGDLKRPYIETDPVKPQGIYACSKEAGESNIRDTLSKHIILRTSWVFGVVGNNFIKTMIRLGKEKNEVSVVTDQIGGPTSASAIAYYLLLMAERLNQDKTLPWGTFHFSQLPYCSWYDFAKEIFDAASQISENKSVKVKATTSDIYLSSVKRPKNSCLNSNKLKSFLEIDNRSYWKNDIKEVILNS
jgi:dTDP-4-dehydrorhamnose reductase